MEWLRSLIFVSSVSSMTMDHPKPFQCYIDINGELSQDNWSSHALYCQVWDDQLMTATTLAPIKKQALQLASVLDAIDITDVIIKQLSEDFVNLGKLIAKDLFPNVTAFFEVGYNILTDNKEHEDIYVSDYDFKKYPTSIDAIIRGGIVKKVAKYVMWESLQTYYQEIDQQFKGKLLELYEKKTGKATDGFKISKEFTLLGRQVARQNFTDVKAFFESGMNQGDCHDPWTQQFNKIDSSSKFITEIACGQDNLDASVVLQSALVSFTKAVYVQYQAKLMKIHMDNFWDEH